MRVLLTDPTTHLVDPALQDEITQHKHRPLLNALVAAGAEVAKFEVATVVRSGGVLPLEEYDAVILLGGRDVQPCFYDPSAPDTAASLSGLIDAAEIHLVGAALSAGKPLLGICRGSQILNVALGGSLLQEVSEVSDLPHNRHDLPSYVSWATSHTVDVAGSRFIADGEYLVSSRHHQAVGNLGAGLRAVGQAPDGIIEMVEHETAPLIGVQWHPEVSYIEQADTLSPLLAALLKN